MRVPGSGPQYSIIVPTRGDPSALRRVGEQVQAVPSDVPFLVVLNRSADAAVRAQLAPGSAAVQFCPGGGVARARNLALRLAPTNIVVFLDDDVIACPEAVAALAGRLDDTSLGLATGRVVAAPSDASAYPLYRDYVGFDRGDADHRFPAGDVPTPMTAWQLGAGAAFAVRRSALDAVPTPPGFDETLSNGRFCGGAEDVDFFMQCLQAGIGIAYCADAVFSHRFPSSLTSVRRKMRAYARADGAFYCKWRHMIERGDLIDDAVAWRRRVVEHAAAWARREPHLPLMTLLQEPAGKAVGALWWRLFATS